MNTAPQSEIELVSEIRKRLEEILSSVTWIRSWKSLEGYPNEQRGFDFAIELESAKGHAAELWVECRSQARPASFPFRELKQELGRETGPKNRIPVLAAPVVSSRMAEMCRQYGWSWIDLSGNCLLDVPGVVTREGKGPAPQLLDSLDDHPPARDLTRKRHKYFIGHMDPSASIEFTRGCPWDCSFCSAWTFYGRSYRKLSPEAACDELASIREPHVFIVDDVAFIKPEHGNALADGIERRGIKKEYYLETRADVLLRNRDVFQRWAKLGLSYMFLGIEALDAEGLKAFRKRSTPNQNFEALEVARGLGIEVAINIIVDPAWDRERFEHLREWALKVPDIVHCTVQTPSPGTEIWHTEARKLTTLDYRLFDVQHAVMPTTLPLHEFYEELVKTQGILAKKHLGWNAIKGAAGLAAKRLMHGQTNFVKMLWKFNSVYSADRQYNDHQRPVKYEMRKPGQPARKKVGTDELYIHLPVVHDHSPDNGQGKKSAEVPEVATDPV